MDQAQRSALRRPRRSGDRRRLRERRRRLDVDRRTGIRGEEGEVDRPPYADESSPEPLMRGVEHWNGLSPSQRLALIRKYDPSGGSMVVAGPGYGATVEDFDPNEVARLVDAHFEDGQDGRNIVWAIQMAQVEIAKKEVAPKRKRELREPVPVP